MGTTDSNMTDTKLIDVYNSDLANTLGNCFSRVTQMINRYFDGHLPPTGPAVEAPVDCRLTAKTSTDRWSKAFEQLRLDQAAAAAMDLVRAIDGYIEATGPFKLAKTPEKKPEVGTILYHCAESLRIASVMLWPLIPGKIENLWQQIGCESLTKTLANRGRGDWTDWVKWGQLLPGQPILKGPPLFPRHTD